MAYTLVKFLPCTIYMYTCATVMKLDAKLKMKKNIRNVLVFLFARLVGTSLRPLRFDGVV